MSSGWERVRLRVETKETLEPNMAKDIRTISTHILDTSLGKAASDVPLTVYRLLNNDQWQELKQTATDTDGRASQLLEANDFKSGIYKLKFNIQKYFDAVGVQSFYPCIEVMIKCETGQHYHVPLLLSPFGYSTYRGT